MAQRFTREPDLVFRKCERGFVFEEGYDLQHDSMGRLYAFDKIEDAGRWLVDRFLNLEGGA